MVLIVESAFSEIIKNIFKCRIDTVFITSGTLFFCFFVFAFERGRIYYVRPWFEIRFLILILFLN